MTKWAQEQFGTCQLGDVRRTRRAVKFAAQAAANPSGHTPEQTETWGDCKAAYRLFDQEEVTFATLAMPHWQRTRASFSGHVLLIDDTTDVCFGQRPIVGMGMIQDERHPGFLLHSALAVEAERGVVLGMAAQTIRHRKRHRKQHSRDRLKRADRESKLWGDVIDQVGPPPQDVVFTHVCDRGADNFEVYCHFIQQRTLWVVRAAQLDRLIFAPSGQRLRLDDYLATLPVAGSYELDLKATEKCEARTAQIEVRFGSLLMPRPHDTSRWVKDSGIREIAMHVVEVREVNPPSGVKPLYWVLCTGHVVSDFEQAYQVIGFYEQRPIVEEYHKALKTGCRLEARLYETAARLEAVTGVLSVVAVRLLQLKTIARTDPLLPAAEVVPKAWLSMINCLPQSKNKPVTTVRDFYRAMAKLGGFLARKHDGEPGWITLWRGFEKLHLLVRGAKTLRRSG